MERKEEAKSFKEKEDERFKEKIVYKIIPVPYYYPVPVDPDWYNKNYERQFRPNEFSSFPFVDTTAEHFAPPGPPPPPPPGFPFPRFRHPHHFIYEPSSHKRGVTSPPPNHAQPPSTSPPKKQVENGHDNETSPHAVKSIQNGISLDSIVPVASSSPTNIAKKNDVIASGDEVDRHNESKNSVDEIIIKTECDDNETIIVNGTETPKIMHEENEVEAIRDRKRYLMTFPYDQKKKVKVNGHGEGHEIPNHPPPEYSLREDSPKKPEEERTTIIRAETHEPTIIHEPIHEPAAHFAAFPPGHGIRYPGLPPGHQAVIPQGGIPYVMVPVQSPATFLHPKLVHQPHFPGDHRPRFDEPPKHLIQIPGDPGDLKLIEMDDRSKDQKAESPGEVKYHPNGRRARTVFTRQQLLTLNNVFEKHHFVSGERMSELSDQLGLDRKIVKIWFQNKRQYSRKKGSLLEREEDYFEYQDSFSSGTAPPTMTMVNVNRTMDDMSYKLNEENVTYKINEDFLNDKSSGDEGMNFKLNDDKANYEVNETV